MIEKLEQRKLFDFTVAEGSPGFYEVTDDAGSDTLTITVTQPTDQTVGSFRINGMAAYQPVDNIIVYGNGGEDTIYATSSTYSNNVHAPISITIHGGDQKDTLTIKNMGGRIDGDDSNDTLRLENSDHGQVYGGYGSDTISIVGKNTSADIRGNEGDDTIDATLSTVPVVLYGDDGVDHMYGSPFADILIGGAGKVSNGVSYGDFMYGYAGDDTIYANNSYPDTVSGGNGNDTVFVDHNGNTVLETSISCENIVLA
jgi:hypothetical protein